MVNIDLSIIKAGNAYKISNEYGYSFILVKKVLRRDLLPDCILIKVRSIYHNHKWSPLGEDCNYWIFKRYNFYMEKVNKDVILALYG